jgi:6-pyruvoyltetrahydropterin/6-carboxytetrahydropterin synthase
MERRNVENERTRIAKEFHWEMGHRLPYHNGGCRNIHGHSYRMQVAIDGTLDEGGMVLDYFMLKEIVDPLVEQLDHSFLCDHTDSEMLEFFEKTTLKHSIVPFFTTAENIVGWFLQQIAPRLESHSNLHTLSVRVYETERTYAERSLDLDRYRAHGK